MRRTPALAALPSVIGGPGADFKCLAPVAATTRRARSRRCINLWRRRQWLPRRLRPELGEDAPQHLYPRGQRVAVVVDFLAQQTGERCNLFVGQIRGHDREMGSFTNPREPNGGSPSAPPAIEAAVLDKPLDRWS
jgi:hypothetical protein